MQTCHEWDDYLFFSFFEYWDAVSCLRTNSFKFLVHGHDLVDNFNSLYLVSFSTCCCSESCRVAIWTSFLLSDSDVETSRTCQSECKELLRLVHDAMAATYHISEYSLVAHLQQAVFSCVQAILGIVRDH